MKLIAEDGFCVSAGETGTDGPYLFAGHHLARWPYRGRLKAVFVTEYTGCLCRHNGFGYDAILCAQKREGRHYGVWTKRQDEISHRSRKALKKLVEAGYP